MNDEYNYKTIELVENSQKAQKFRKYLKVGTLLLIAAGTITFYYLFIFDLLPYAAFNSKYEMDRQKNNALFFSYVLTWIMSLINIATLIKIEKTVSYKMLKNNEKTLFYINSFVFISLVFVYILWILVSFIK